MTITEAIVELARLREQYNGEMELVTGHGEVNFRLVKLDGVEDCIAICDGEGRPV